MCWKNHGGKAVFGLDVTQGRYIDYGGPCPPIGQHRYFHKLYALNIFLPDLNRPTKAKLEKAMQGHILYKAELIGLYRRK